jgi:hypothetical protein
MARFKIYSSDGLTARYEGTPVYYGTYMKVPYIEFKDVSSPVPIEWAIGDYVDYTRTGFRYKLYNIPQPKKQARKNEAGDAFVYDSVKLYDATKQLEIALFNDVVVNHNGVHFSSKESFSTYEDVYGIANRIQANMDEFYPDAWTIQVMDFDETEDADIIAQISEAKNFQTSNGGTCLNALNQIYNTWDGIGWIHTYDSTTGKDVITIGRPNKRSSDNTTSPFLYGKGLGLTAIRKSYTNEEDFGTRIYPFGSTQNMPNRYYNGKDIYNADSVDIEHLMIPISKWGTTNGKPDPAKAYVEDTDKIAKYGLIPKKVYFNDDENGAVYPTIEDVTIGEIRAAKAEMNDTEYVPSTTIYPDDSEIANKLKSAVNPSDNGIEVDDANDFLENQNVTISVAKRQCSYGTTYEIQLASVTAGHDGKGYLVWADLNNTLVNFSSGLFSNDSLSAFLVVKRDGKPEVEIDLSYVDKLEDDEQAEAVSMMIPTNALINDITSGEVITWYLRFKAQKIYPASGREESYSYYVEVPEAAGTFSMRNSLTSTFYVVIKQIGFDISKRVATVDSGIGTLSMLDGMCGGREFTIRSCTYQEATDDWKLGISRQKDSDTGMYYPNSVYPLAAGDRFALLGFTMPELYVEMASQKLYEKAVALLADISTGKAFYEPEIDNIQMARSEVKLREGMYMRIDDDDILETGTDYAIIDTLTIDEGEAEIPTYKVTLREKKKISYVEATASAIADINGRIDVLASGQGFSSRLPIVGTDDTTEPSDRNVYSALRSMAEFLSKRSDDTAKGWITLLKGINLGDFASGVTGFGGRIDGSGNAELESLVVRRFLEVPELRYNRVEVFVGNRWRSPGAGIIESVTVDKDDSGNALTTGTITLHLEDNELGAIAVDDICMGIFHDYDDTGANATANSDDGYGNFQFAGFATCYFKITEITETAHNSEFKYELRPVSDRWTSQIHPISAMHFCCYGNFSNTDRQSSRYSTLTYERFLKNVNDWELTKDNLAAQFGDLSNLSVYGLNMDGYSAYLDNVYFKGIIQSADGSVVLDAMNRTMKLGDSLTYSPSDGLRIKGSVIVDGSGEQVTLPSYKGPWGASTSYSKGDTVTYQGTTYIYTYALPTSGHAPTEAGYWSVYAKAGDTGKDGESFYHIEVTADGSTSLRSADDTLTLTARIFYGSTDVTDKFADADVFWTRKSEAGESESWDGRTHTGKTLTIGYSDIAGADFFYANVVVETTGDALTSLGSVLIKISDELLKV